MRTYQLLATVTGPNAANVQVWKPGRIVAVSWSSQSNSVADGGRIAGELSFQSGTQITTNDAQGIISHYEGFFLKAVTAVGQFSTHDNFFVGGLDIPTGVAGSFIYLHTLFAGTGTLIAVVHCLER